MPDTNINFPVALNQPSLIDKAVITRQNITAMQKKVRAARTTKSDSDKMFRVYWANKNSTMNYAAKGYVYINTLLRSLTMRTAYHDTASQPKVKFDSLLATDVASTISTKFISAIPETTIVVDSQARKIYYSLGSFEVFVKGDFNRIKDHKDILDLFFNDIKLSNTAIKDEKTSTAKPTFNFASKGFVPLVTIEKHKLPESLTGMSDNFRPSSKDYPREIAAIPEFNIEFEEAQVNSVFGEQKTIDISMRTVEMTFKVTLRLVYPLAYAYWATFSKTNTNFSIPNFFNLITGHIVDAAGKLPASRSIERLMPMQTSLDMLQERVDKLGLSQEPRINRNRFTILGDGEVYYIPKDGDLKAYDTMIKNSYDPQTKKVTPVTYIKELHNVYLVSDWVHNVGVYTNASGVINTVNFTGAMAFNDRFVARYFKQKDFKRAFSLDIAAYLAIGKEVGDYASIHISDIVPQDSELHHYTIDMLFARVLPMASIYDVTYGEVFDITSEFFTELGENDKDTIKLFMKVNEAIFKNMFKVRTTKAISTLMAFALPFYIFGIAGPRILHYNEVYEKQKEENTKSPTNYLTTMQTQIQLPNLPGFNDGLLPHQGDAYLSSFYKAPKTVSLDVSAGGGKTGLMIIDMVTLLNTHKIKRPIILCPAKLVSEWVSEVNKWSQGQLNPYPLTSNSVIKLSKYLGYDRNKLLEVIKNAPLNTIFIASYSFLKVADPFKDADAGVMQYGGNKVDFYPNTQFIRQGGFDYIACDESHRLKSLKAQVSKATRSVLGSMEYRRIASGTILFNTVDDLTGQVALLNPGILGDMRMAIEENTVTDNNGKIIGMAKISDDTIASQMNPYVSRMVYRRRDWAFLLPRMNFSFLQCDMTENQREYYQEKVRKKIEELMEKPEIKKILESEDQEKIDKLMKSLSLNFQKMEIFLNCPDTDEAFRLKPGITREDLIPPKSKLVNQIIQAHFTGGTVTDVVGNSATFHSTKAKIIVFAYNKAVSLEIFKYLSSAYKSRFVHYSSENKDAILKFRDDPNIIGIVADETSVREGYNLTMASHVIRLQSLWTPGAEEQAMARIFRADTKNKYGRKELYVTHLMCRDSLDIAKTARNISKKVNNLKESEGDRPDWRRFIKNTNIPDLDQIKMNLKLLQSYGRVESVGKYFNAYRDINMWEFEESKEITQGLAHAVEKKLGLPPDSLQGPEGLETLRANSATPFMATGMLEGSKAIWTPLVPNATILDKLGLELQPLAIVKAGSNDEEEDENDSDNDDDNEGDEDLEDNITYSEGDMVVTEFGIGFIRNVRQGRIGSPNEGKNTSVNVYIPGFQKYYPAKDYVNLSLLEVFKPTNLELAAQIEKRLRKLEQKNQGILFVKDGIASANIKDILTKVSPSDIKKPKIIDLPPPVIKPAKHPGVNPENDLDLNDIVPADRTGKKPPVVEPPPRRKKDDEIAPPAPGMKPLVKPPVIVAPKDTTTQRKPKLMDDDDVVVKPKGNIPPLPPGLDINNRNKILKDFNKSPDKLYHYQKQTDTHSVVVDAAVINGEIAFITYPGEENFSALEGASPDRWNRVAPFVFIKVKTYQGAIKLCDRLENEFTLIDGTTDRILKLAKAMQSKSRPAVEQNQKMDFTSLKNFVLINHKAPTTDNGLKLYPTVYDGWLYVIASYPTQIKSIRRLMQYNITGCDKPKLNRPVSGYLFFRNKNAALRGLAEIAQELHVVNYEQVAHDLKTMPVFTSFVGK